MIDVGVVVASVPDLLRLVVLPLFAWAAWRDVRTRRVPGRVWPPLVALAVVLLAVDAQGALTAGGDVRRRFLVQVVLSLGLVSPLAYLFWRLAGFGGADAKALMTLALLVPTYPAYLTTAALQELGVPGSVPVVETSVPVFAFTALTNAVVVGAAYPLALVAYNAARGDRSSIMFLARPVAVDRVPETYGRLLERADGTAGRGLDLDALRMYLRWRGLTLADLRDQRDRLRHPDSLPEHPNPPGDGVVTAGGRPEGDDLSAEAPSESPTEEAGRPETSGAVAEGEPDDPWGAAAFLDDLEGSAYGTSPTDLRDGLDLLTDPDTERVWVSPGLPFMLPLFLGTLVAFTYGDVLFGVLGAAGVV